MIQCVLYVLTTKLWDQTHVVEWNRKTYIYFILLKLDFFVRKILVVIQHNLELIGKFISSPVFIDLKNSYFHRFCTVNHRIENPGAYRYRFMVLAEKYEIIGIFITVISILQINFKLRPRTIRESPISNKKNAAK